ncbi:MAG: hypothetical protein RL071_2374 [Pseudomonadota bacterium]|jgi:peptide/nickel transport system permease protein
MRRAHRALAAAPLCALAACGLVFGVVEVDLVADLLPGRAGQGPGAGLLLGADHLGRSVGLRLAVAAGISAGPALLAAVVGLGLGLPLGAAAGWWPGARGQVAVALTDALGAVPPVVYALLFALIFGDQPKWIGIGVGIGGGAALARALRARIEELRAVSFVEASLLHGVPAARVLLHHLLWTGSRRLLAQHAVGLAVGCVLVEAALSYIGGFGVQEPLPSWGNMIASGFGQPRGQPLAWAAPALCLLALGAGGAALTRALGAPDRGAGG